MWTSQEHGVSIDQRNPHRYPMALHTSAVLRCPFLRSFPMWNISRIGYAAMGLCSYYAERGGIMLGFES